MEAHTVVETPAIEALSIVETPAVEALSVIETPIVEALTIVEAPGIEALTIVEPPIVELSTFEAPTVFEPPVFEAPADAVVEGPIIEPHAIDVHVAEAPSYEAFETLDPATTGDPDRAWAEPVPPGRTIARSDDRARAADPMAAGAGAR